MSMSEDNQQQLRQHLDQHIQQLAQDTALNRRLDRARADAMAAYKKTTPFKRRGLNALAATFVLALMIPLLFVTLHRDEITQDMSLADMELVAELELFEQDMAFYYWLESNDAHSG